MRYVHLRGGEFETYTAWTNDRYALSGWRKSDPLAAVYRDEMPSIIVQRPHAELNHSFKSGLCLRDVLDVVSRLKDGHTWFDGTTTWHVYAGLVSAKFDIQHDALVPAWRVYFANEETEAFFFPAKVLSAGPMTSHTWPFKVVNAPVSDMFRKEFGLWKSGRSEYASQYSGRSLNSSQ